MTERERTPMPAAVAEAIRSARAGLGLSVREAARRAGVDAPMWWRLEHAERSPSAAVAEAISDALELVGDQRDAVLAAGVPGRGRDKPRWERRADR